jgi:hypothetical protein
MSGSVLLSDDAVTAPDLIWFQALVYAWAGETGRAIDRIDTLLSIPSEISVSFVRNHPWLEQLSDDPRFQDMLTQHERPASGNP